MQQPDNTNPESVKPDLKHDTMEFNAASEGDDILDTDKEAPLQLEDESITAEELSSLEDDEVEDQQAALQSAEEDSLEDQDNFINEPDERIEDIVINPGIKDEEEERENERTS